MHVSIKSSYCHISWMQLDEQVPLNSFIMHYLDEFTASVLISLAIQLKLIVFGKHYSSSSGGPKINGKLLEAVGKEMFSIHCIPSSIMYSKHPAIGLFRVGVILVSLSYMSIVKLMTKNWQTTSKTDRQLLYKMKNTQ